ncbi:hypothetical protein PINS_up000850 [Pythium insidiosum]|nr:hypothetical protein PINS_up000850 [Pythium insidiosum]
MTITRRVQTTLFAADDDANELIRLAPSIVNHGDRFAQDLSDSKRTARRPNLWTVDEHERFLKGLEMYPKGPWRCIAEIVGTRTTRQTMTHAQKYRQKIIRRKQSELQDPTDKAKPRRKRTRATSESSSIASHESLSSFPPSPQEPANFHVWPMCDDIEVIAMTKPIEHTELQWNAFQPTEDVDQLLDCLEPLFAPVYVV